jgi:hypothetical protein
MARRAALGRIVGIGHFFGRGCASQPHRVHRRRFHRLPLLPRTAALDSIAESPVDESIGLPVGMLRGGSGGSRMPVSGAGGTGCNWGNQSSGGQAATGGNPLEFNPRRSTPRAAPPGGDRQPRRPPGARTCRAPPRPGRPLVTPPSGPAASPERSPTPHAHVGWNASLSASDRCLDAALRNNRAAGGSQERGLLIHRSRISFHQQAAIDIHH